MKILLDYQERKKFPNCPNWIPDELLNEEWADYNHGQTLKRLNERMGMGPEEIMANIDGIWLREAYKKYTIEQAIDQIIKLIDHGKN